MGELEAALAKAFKEDEQVLVEEFIKGREFTIGVFRSKGKIITLPITEIIVGPCADQNLSASGVRYILRSLKLENIEIHLSNSTLR